MTKDRDRNGKFVSGNSAAVGHGRPSRQTEDDYLRILLGKVTPDVWGDIVDSAVRQAKQGDNAARNWLTKYLVGTDHSSLVGMHARAELDPDNTIIDRQVKLIKSQCRQQDKDQEFMDMLVDL